MTRDQLLALGNSLVTQYGYRLLKCEEQGEVLYLSDGRELEFSLSIEPLGGRWHDLDRHSLVLRQVGTNCYLNTWTGLGSDETVSPASVNSVISRQALELT